MTDLVERVWTALKQRVCSDPSNAKRCVMVSYDDLAAALRSQADERGKVVAWLRAESDKGADLGIAEEKGTTRRAAYGGGSLALHRAADAIERGDHDRTDPSPDHTEPSRDAGEAFQNRVDAWMDACFGDAIKADMLERADRFCEEALELVQTVQGFGPERAHALVDYVFGRPVGVRFQEVGGVRVTLSALCNADDINEDGAADTELARVWTKVEQIRAKQAAKPTGSALPIALATPPEPSVHTDTPMDGGWLPIESAPKEGDPSARVLIAYDGVVGEAYFRIQGDHDDGWWWAGETPGDNYAEKLLDQLVTHWQPLPPAPTDHSHPENSHEA